MVAMDGPARRDEEDVFRWGWLSCGNEFGIRKYKEWINCEKRVFNGLEDLYSDINAAYAGLFALEVSPWWSPSIGPTDPRYIVWYVIGCEGGYFKRKNMRKVFLSPLLAYNYQPYSNRSLSPHPL